jgi:hypothetical protein
MPLRNITIATPAKLYVNSRYAISLISSVTELAKNFNFRINILPGKSNIIHARSIMLTQWYDSSAGDDLLIFIDSDHVFSADDILTLINMAPTADICCGIYCNSAGVPTCYPMNRENFDVDNRVFYAATGFMLISRPICTKIHEYIKFVDGVDRVNVDQQNRHCIPFFRTRYTKAEIAQDQPQEDWLGEDYSFCWLARQVGGTIRAKYMPNMAHEVTNIRVANVQSTVPANPAIPEIPSNPSNPSNPSSPSNPSIIHNPVKAVEKWADTIVYYCGTSRVLFSPNIEALGGSEKAVVNISRQWALAGHTVFVYGNVLEGKYDDVTYLRSNKFDVNQEYDVVVLWRGFGLEKIDRLRARKILVDFHDSTNISNIPQTFLDKVDYFMVKSQYHASLFPGLPADKVIVLPNGLEDIIFQVPSQAIIREPHRFIYTSCYTRGLDSILKHVWPHIRSSYPDAELHLFYGTDLVPETQRNQILRLVHDTDGVYDHGRVPIKTILEERHRATYHLYLSTARTEIDCLSIRESSVCGCIPITWDNGLFKERLGYRIPFTDTTFNTAVKEILNLMGNPSLAKDVLGSQMPSVTEKRWTEIALSWLPYMLKSE